MVNQLMYLPHCLATEATRVSHRQDRGVVNPAADVGVITTLGSRGEGGRVKVTSGPILVVMSTQLGTVVGNP